MDHRKIVFNESNNICNIEVEIFLLSWDEFINPAIKNKCIKEFDSEWLLIAFAGCYPADDAIIDLIKKENKDAYIFGDNIKDEIKYGLDILLNFNNCIYGFLIRKNSILRTGRFNEYLTLGGNLEFACRIADTIRFDWKDISTADTGELIPEFLDMDSLAFLCCHYQTRTDDDNIIGNAISEIVSEIDKLGRIDEFRDSLSYFVSSEEVFIKYSKNTAPILILIGDDTCYGVMRDFARDLAKAMVDIGQPVITTDGKYLMYHGLEKMDDTQIRAVVGFQSPALKRQFFKNMNIPKIQFWFDDPIYFFNEFDDLDKNYIFLCQDGYHADYLRRYFGISEAIQFSPGGTDNGKPDYIDRDMDIVFIGTYKEPDRSLWNDPKADEYCDYMIKHPRFTYIQGIEGLWGSNNSETEVTINSDMINAFRYLKEYFRHRVIEEVLNAGYYLNVYGYSWSVYNGSGKDHLIIHDELDKNEMIHELNRAKISLNVMSWHKNGMTERIVNSMLSGAVCFSDETLYLKDRFQSEGMMELFSLDNLGEIPDKLKYILENDDIRINMAEKSYLYAKENETWTVKAEKILKMIECF